KNPGDKIKISLIRDNKPIELYVVLMEKQSTEIVNKVNPAVLDELGATFKEIPNDLKNKLRLKSGLQINELKEGLLSNAGIKKGFIITQVDKKPVHSVEELSGLLENKEGGVLIEGVYPNGMRAYYGFGL
ncbi:MAG: deoxyribonuclease HsdR, partial [Bacteroidota bacterium]|nr:deoxyribonuclease HsdR [Bacteroidota bacterium]